MIEQIQEKYIENIKSLTAGLTTVENKIKFISYGRLAIALFSILIFYFALTSQTSLFYLLILLIAIFVALAMLHVRLFRKRDILQNTIRINKEELQYLNQNYTSFDAGSEFVDFSHSNSFDLDLFGKGSLYQSISRAVTFQGKHMLASTLTQPLDSKKAILTRQESIKELKDKLSFRQQFQATGLLLKETQGDREKLNQWLQEDFHFIQNKPLFYSLYVLPLISLVFIIVSFVQWEFHPVLTLIVLANWLLFGLYSKKINRIYLLISKKKLLLENYASLFNIAHQEQVSSEELMEIKNSLNNASSEFIRLADYVSWFDQRLNILISPVLNSFFLFDLQCTYRLEKWRADNQSRVLQWMDSLGKLDVICSLGNFAYNNPDFIFPELEEGELTLEAKELAHPLIKTAKRIPNDFAIGRENHIAVITGANMAGKSTFLRTVGVNIVLSHAGAPVCARKFKSSLVDLITSMRISDSLKDDVSYFYAELQRLKFIKQKAEKGMPVLILLDEMLKGTNSKDKQQGSKSFVEGLIKSNCLALVATHDLLLGQLENEYPGKIKNFCFESFLKDNQLLFDYQIRKGIAQNTNASFLMKNLGII